MSKWTLAWKSTCLKIKHAATIFQLRHDCTKSRNRRRQSHGLYRWLRSRGWCRRVWRRTWGWIRRRPGRRIPRRRRSNILQQVPRIDQLIKFTSDLHAIGSTGIAPLQHHDVAIQHTNVAAANLRQSEVVLSSRVGFEEIEVILSLPDSEELIQAQCVGGGCFLPQVALAITQVDE